MVMKVKLFFDMIFLFMQPLAWNSSKIISLSYIKVHTATRWTIRHSLMLHWFADLMNVTTGGPSSSCETIILRNNGHGGIIRVCIGIFTSALRNKKIRQILKKNTSPRFHSVLLVIWPLTLMKRAHLSELFISRFSTYIRKAQGWTLHFRTPDPRSEKSKLKMTGRPQIQRRIQAHIL